MSKTSKRRPGEGFADGWERIFGKKDTPTRFSEEYEFYEDQPVRSPRKPDARENVRDASDKYLRGIPPMHPADDGAYSYVANYIKKKDDAIVFADEEPADRVCGNCRHWASPVGMDTQCTSVNVWEMIDGDTQAVDFVTTADFGCAHFEPNP